MAIRAVVQIMLPRLPVLLLHVTSILLGSFLLFLVQPLAGRILLPAFGGSPAVWTTALVFFQLLLLAGYLYAHLLVRLRPAAAGALHLCVLALPLVLLPPSAPAGLDPSTSAWPAATLLGALAAMVGAPFLVLASNSSLVQVWWSAGGRPGSQDPYWLYAASNLGSLGALLAYPFVLEPRLDLPAQGTAWALGYGVFALTTAAVLVLTLRNGRGTAGERAAVAPERGEVGDVGSDARSEPSTALRRTFWVIRSAAGSGLLVALTTRITTDAAPFPFLWVAPLAAYLVTYIVAFAMPRRFRRSALAGSTALGLAVSMVLLVLPVQLPLSAVVAVSLWTLFFGALLCHRDLAVDRPPARELTSFYLLLALGGALGGVLNSLVAPLLFDSLAEVPLTLMAVALLLHADPEATRGYARRPLPPRAGFAAALAVVLLLVGVLPPSATVWGIGALAALAAGFLIRWIPETFAVAVVLLGSAYLASGPAALLAQERSFFGVTRVRVVGEEIRMIHGSTVHGGQSINPLLRRIPRSYYHPSGPMGSAVAAAPDGAGIGVVGLGTGALAVLTRSGQEMVFHEIDPVVERLARDHFTFLEDAPGAVRMEIGDGRVTLGRVPPESYDLLVVDAFSSGNVPIHLLTVEALDLFRSRVRPGGVLLIHLSNQHADLRRVVKGYAERAGVPVAIASHSPSPGAQVEGADPSVVAALPSLDGILPTLPGGNAWPRAHPGVPSVVWTDNRADLLSVLR